MTDQSLSQPRTFASVITGVFALLTAKAGVTRDQVTALVPAEVRATV